MTSSPSIIPILLNDLVSISKGELLPFERLYVTQSSGLAGLVPERTLVDLYMECGCFERARNIYTQIRHWRKLGDLAWIQGDLNAARDYYSRPEDHKGTVVRAGPDWDRLIKLAFFRGEWESVLNLVCEAPISPGLTTGSIILGSSETSSKAYLNMAAIAFTKLGRLEEGFLSDRVSSAFGVATDDWSKLVLAESGVEDSVVRSLQKQCLPRPAFREQLSLEEALTRGDTPRARGVMEFLTHADSLLARASRILRGFVEGGNERDLKAFVEIVTQSGVDSMSQSLLFTAMANDGYDPKDAPAERLARLYGSHPVMNRRYFGRLLEAKFKAGMPVTGSDLLTGLFQRMASLESGIHGGPLEAHLDFHKLAAASDWAEIRLDDWAVSEGHRRISEVARMWNEGKAARVMGPFDTSERYPQSPREMREWLDLIDHCHDWLTERWEIEISVSIWVSETRLFELVKKAFRGKEVIRHGQPIWLAPQHLDIFIPELSLAIEYMGLQHYQPVEFFGGQEGFLRTVYRDKKKAEICYRAQIELVYVRFDEDIAERVTQIRRQFG
jgi:hypothetical protein